MTETRARVLAAASALFSERDYERTSVAEIRLRAGVTNGSVFHAFPTKAAIAHAVVEEARQRYAAFIGVSLEQHHDPDPHRLASAVIGGHLAWVESEPEAAALVYRLDHACWAFDATGQPTAALASPMQTLSAHRRRLNLGMLSDVALIGVLLGAAEIASRTWLAGRRVDQLGGRAAQLATLAAAALNSVRPPSSAASLTSSSDTPASRAEGRWNKASGISQGSLL